MLRALRISFAKDEQLSEPQTLEKIVSDVPINTEIEILSLQTIIKACDLLNSKYSSSIEEDEKILQTGNFDGDQGYRKKMAILYQKEEKKICTNDKKYLPIHIKCFYSTIKFKLFKSTRQRNKIITDYLDFDFDFEEKRTSFD